MPLRNRDLVDLMFASWPRGQPVSPTPPWPAPLTSVARRWSQRVGIRMRRTSPHPRPWDGPLREVDGMAFLDHLEAGGTLSNLLNTERDPT
jgi:hypothetical protein